MQRSRVVSVGLQAPTGINDEGRVEANLQSVIEALETVDRHDPDLVVFPETVLQAGASCPAIELACPVPGPETDAVGERAQSMGAHVLLPMAERNGEEAYNAAVLIGETGDVIGRYHKMRPTTGEIDNGTTPGAAPRVWDTPIGRIGAAICFDLHFQEVAMGLAQEHADLVVFPSMMAGDEMLRAWAINHGFHVVQCTADEVAVYTPGGDRVAANDNRNVGMVTELSTGAKARIGIAEVNTDAVQVHLGALQREYEAIMDAYGDSLTVDKCSTEAYAVVESTGDVSVTTILDEYDLETKQEYIERSREAAVASRPESAPTGDRSETIPAPESSS